MEIMQNITKLAHKQPQYVILDHDTQEELAIIENRDMLNTLLIKGLDAIESIADSGDDPNVHTYVYYDMEDCKVHYIDVITTYKYILGGYYEQTK